MTGFAVNQYGLDDKYADLTHEQSFMTYDITENALSLEEYTAKFMEYYNKLMEAPNLEEAAKAKLDEAKLHWTPQMQPLPLPKKRKQAAAELETRKQETAAAKEKVEVADEDAMSAVNELAIKENNVKSAKDFVDSAQNDVYEQQANVNNASLNLANANNHAMNAQDHHNDALTVQAEKQKAFEDAKAAYEKYVNGKRTMIPTVADAEKELKDAQDKLAGTQNKVKV